MLPLLSDVVKRPISKFALKLLNDIQTKNPWLDVTFALRFPAVTLPAFGFVNDLGMFILTANLVFQAVAATKSAVSSKLTSATPMAAAFSVRIVITFFQNELLSLILQNLANERFRHANTSPGL